MILERAEFDTKQIKNIIETIAASLKTRGGKGFIKHQLTFYVGNEIAERAKARTKDHFDSDVQLHKNNAGNAIATIENISRILLAHKHLNIRYDCLLYTSDAADERSSVDLGGR